jgi:hypothetical protein
MELSKADIDSLAGFNKGGLSGYIVRTPSLLSRDPPSGFVRATRSNKASIESKDHGKESKASRNVHIRDNFLDLHWLLPSMQLSCSVCLTFIARYQA